MGWKTEIWEVSAELQEEKLFQKKYLREHPGDYPVYSSQTQNNGVFGRIDSYVYEGEYLTWTTDGANAGTIFRRSGKFNITNVCGLLDVDRNICSIDFLFHYLQMCMKSYVSSGMGNPKLMSNVVQNIQIPVPPMEVQQEIVCVLDSFAELEAELERRKAQYAYYRDKLLTSPLNLKLIKLGDICDLSNGDRGKSYPKQSEILEAGVPFVNAGDLINGKVNVLDCKKISKSKYDSMGGAKLKKGDILYCLRGSTGKNAIFTCDEGTVASSLVSIRPHEGFSNRYIFYLLNSSMELVQRNAKDTGAAQPNLSAASVKEYVFPVPPLEEQQRIVDILDKFDALVNDISQGLPAEIEARRKQYEYYRDKLLTFKKKEN